MMYTHIHKTTQCKTFLLSFAPMKIAVCCAMNQNRSMEAHKVLVDANIPVSSYGTSPQIKIPGETVNTPNIYTYDMPYKHIYTNLLNKNHEFYEKIGITQMLTRNMKIKDTPQYYFDKTEHHDLVITAEEKCFVAIYNYHQSMEGDKKMYLVGFDIKDTIQDATIGAQEIKYFAQACLQTQGTVEEKILYGLEYTHAKYRKNNLFTVLDVTY